MANDEDDNKSTNGRPTEEECWEAFWDGVATMWLSLPRETQLKYAYRTCAECGGDCHPDASVGTDSLGARIAFVCPEHGVHSVVDPFEDKR